MPTLHFAENSTPTVTELEDGTKVIRTCSAGFGCHKLGCGMKVYVKDDELIKVEGDEENPITQGRLCVRCLTAKEYFYHEDRLLHPMKRAKKDRGKDKWERITWDEAYDLIIEKYWDAVNNYGVNSVSVWNGTGRYSSAFHFAMANDVFGTQTAVHPNSGWSCIVPRMATMLWTMGSSYIEADNSIGLVGRYDNPAWECPNYMLVLGRDPLRSNADGLFGHSIIDMMKRGMKLVVADPRANWLATRAEVHLQLRPGTDGALAMGLLNVAIEHDLVDHEFVDAWTYGFDELSERVKDYPPEKVGEICGIDPDDIVHAAQCLAQAPSTLSMGLAVDQNPNCMQIGHALLSFFAITGSMDVPGGCFMGLPPTFAGMAENSPDEEEEEEEGEPEGLAKFDNLDNEPLGHDRFPAYSAIINTTVPDATLDALEETPGVIRFAYMFNNNPISCMVPQPKRWLAGLQGIDFVCVADIVKTPTIMAVADLVLPASTFLEYEGYISNSNASQPGQFGAMVRCLTPRGECKSDLEIMLDIHHRLYPNSTNVKYRSVEDYYREDMAGIPGVDCDLAELTEHVIGQYELEYKKYERGMLRADGSVGFNTSTGRIELWSTMLQSLGDDPLPYYIEPHFSAVSRPDLAEEYPLTVTTGGRRFTSFHSENRHIKTLREIHEWPTVEVNPETAKERGITEGSWVYVENHLGKIKMNAHLTPIVKRDVVHCDHGWWFPERDPEDLYGVFDSTAGQLIPHEENGPLGFGTLYKSMPCTIYPAEEEVPAQP